MQILSEFHYDTLASYASLLIAVFIGTFAAIVYSAFRTVVNSGSDTLRPFAFLTNHCTTKMAIRFRGSGRSIRGFSFSHIESKPPLKGFLKNSIIPRGAEDAFYDKQDY